jgi:hypothetical protein
LQAKLASLAPEPMQTPVVWPKTSCMRAARRHQDTISTAWVAPPRSPRYAQVFVSPVLDGPVTQSTRRIGRHR